MNILQINKFYHIVGGVDRYFFEISQILKEKDHQIAYFSMNDYRNNKSEWSRYFVNNISFENVEIRNGLKVFGRMIYSIEARKKISELLDKFACDIVHAHDMYHHISPSILHEIKKRDIPVIQTIGDYHLISPNYIMFHQGRICEITKSNNFWKAFFHRCVKDSYLASFAEVVEKYLHYWLGWERNYIDHFIAPSRFMESKLIEYGINKKKVVYLPYFIHYQAYKSNYNGDNYILYFGRLSPEKGLNYLINAMKVLPQINLKIAGRGNSGYVSKLKAQSAKMQNVEFVGFQEGLRLKRLISCSKFTILSSVWYEVFGLSILESFASGKPVVASNIGGIPETVKDGYNGLLFEPGNTDDCAEKINKLWNNPALCRKMGRNAREYVEKNFGPEEHYERLMEIYRKAIERHRR